MASLGDRILRRELKTGGNNECGQHIVKLAHEINLLTDESPRQLLLSGFLNSYPVLEGFGLSIENLAEIRNVKNAAIE